MLLARLHDVHDERSTLIRLVLWEIEHDARDAHIETCRAGTMSFRARHIDQVLANDALSAQMRAKQSGFPDELAILSSANREVSTGACGGP